MAQGPKFGPENRVIVRSGLPHLVGQTGTIHCEPVYDLQSWGAPRYIGWWYHVVFDRKEFERNGSRWWCSEEALERFIQDGGLTGSWDVIHSLTGWKPKETT